MVRLGTRTRTRQVAEGVRPRPAPTPGTRRGFFLYATRQGTHTHAHWKRARGLICLLFWRLVLAPPIGHWDTQLLTHPLSWFLSVRRLPPPPPPFPFHSHAPSCSSLLRSAWPGMAPTPRLVLLPPRPTQGLGGEAYIG